MEPIKYTRKIQYHYPEGCPQVRLKKDCGIKPGDHVLVTQFNGKVVIEKMDMSDMPEEVSEG